MASDIEIASDYESGSEGSADLSYSSDFRESTEGSIDEVGVEILHDSPDKRKYSSESEEQSDGYDSGLNDTTDELVSDGNAHKTCYLITSKKDRRKRPRTQSFFSLPDQGLVENDVQTEQRWRLFRRLTDQLQSKVSNILDSAYNSAIENVTKYVMSIPDYDPIVFPLLPLGLILAGSNISDHSRFFANMRKHIESVQEAGTATAVISFSTLSGLKDVLKSVISQLANQERIDDDEQAVGIVGDKRLSYDLDILVDWYRNQSTIKKLVVIIQDADGTTGNLLQETIRMLYLYRNRLPLVLLLGIATTLPIFSTKIPKWNLRMVEFESFDVSFAKESIIRLMDEVILSSTTEFLMGPSLYQNLLDRYNSHTKNLETFTSAIHYAHMAHFFSEPLSILIEKSADLSDDHILALRSVPSFRQFVEEKIESRAVDKKSIELLLVSPKHLIEFVDACREAFRSYVVGVREALELLEILQSTVGKSTVKRSRINLYADALSGKLAASAWVNELLSQITNGISMSTIDELIRLIKERYPESSNLRITVDSWRFNTAQDLASLPQVHAGVRSYLGNNLKSYEGLTFHELFVYNDADICATVFTPSYRGSIERALMRPADYLGQAASANDSYSPSSWPLICSVHSLYRDSGSIINVYDFWNAFHQVIGGDSSENIESKPERRVSGRQTVAWFYQAISELKYLGFLRTTSTSRGTKNSVAVLQKLVWDGL